MIKDKLVIWLDEKNQSSPRYWVEINNMPPDLQRKMLLYDMQGKKSQITSTKRQTSTKSE